MQPTPLTWQWSLVLRWATSLSSASLTDWLWHERHPAATHTFTRWVKVLCCWRSVSAIWSSSSGVMLHPFLQVLADRRRSNLARDLLVVDHRRSEAARSQAARR